MSPEQCREVFEMLSEYLDGELPADACEQIERHIGDCPPCIEFVESLRKSIEVFRDYRPVENPPPLDEDARRRLAEAYRAMLDRRGTPGLR
jgi:RNA polymerase sigma-70 factor (ECF subfamily)